MAPQKKVKKTPETKSTVTLHKFFTTPVPSKPNATPKSSAKSSSKPRTSDAKQPSTTRVSREIIVIDSDSEHEVAPKKRKRRDSSSDVEVVESVPVKRANTLVPEPTVVSSSSNTSVSFGAPSALLGGLTFGKPSSLLGPCPPSTDDEAEAVPFEGEDDWGMGDDEIVVIPDDDEEPSMHLDDPPGISSCPICAMDLSQLSDTDSQSHVNACLDGPKPGPSKPFLKPLSSFPVPRASSARSDAFSVLMTSGKELEAWNEATLAESSRATKTNRRKAPFYKVMDGMPIAVDAFRYGCIPGVTAYFLTHAHSDHYTNLSSSWKHGPIYCSEGTANLIIHLLSVDKKWVHPLPMDVSTVIPNTGGVHVTLIEANHCPGSSLFLFEGPQTVHAGDSVFKSPFIGSSKTFRYLHCGDFRASPQHVLHPAVKGKHLDHVYLDTTYLDPRYTFPPQPLVISACAEAAKRIAAGKALENGGGPKMMDAWMAITALRFLPAAVAQAVKSKIYCDARKAAILRCQPDPELHALLTADPLAADVHILPLGMISLEKLEHYLQRFKGAFSKVVGFRPTGWTFSPPAGTSQSPSIPSVISSAQQRSFTYANLRPARGSTNGGVPQQQIVLIPVPYSEHSSFFELTCFALSIKWGRMIATVNVGSERSRAKMGRWIKKWEEERRKRAKDQIVPSRRDDYW
ncbi:beta-lactamase-like protein [Roridomyces roridus]|uniref:Beta-lactamase-like protein n=1 Tax=Roridomyces roridus TaxID=1738132 RepID=A0AAD7FL75_9AGAR|nr:beta-lactamase-like protein [Roridomyces roridus]